MACAPIVDRACGAEPVVEPREQVFHFVEQDDAVTLVTKKPLAQAELLQAFRPRGLIPIVICHANGMKAGAEPLSEGLAELRFTGTWNPVQ